MSARWSEIQMFEPSTARMQDARIYSSEVSSDAQHFDILRTKLFLEMRRNGWTRIAITSATAGCGKTTTACNLIAGLGRQPESRGILFDMDFRRPSVAKRFGVKPELSLEQVFLGEVEFSEQARRLNENTAVAMTSNAVHDPARVILRSQTAETLDHIQSFYKPELMLFDLPPVLVSDETRGFLKLVDAVLIMASAENSTVAQIDEVEREIAQYCNVAGVVLNECRYMDDGYGYAY
ncbi:MAG: CpsD/CapB family tyrosine-protein kinase [Paracoccaceae bacterium]